MEYRESKLSCRNRYTDGYMYSLDEVELHFVQPQLLKQWRSFRRALMQSDPSNTGRVSAMLFQAVLEKHGVHLTREQIHGLMESLDPQQTGIINYTNFVNILTD